MKRVAVLVVLALSATACVNGTTPDCSTPASGCYPGGNPQDASGDASDASSTSDAADGGQTDASDASSVTDSPSD